MSGHQWISAAICRPPRDERVLFCAEIDGVFGHEVNLGRWDGRLTSARSDGFQACVMDYGDESGDWEPCTHWMRLPALPDAELSPSEIARLRLTDEEREAIKAALGSMAMWMIENKVNDDESLRRTAVTLRKLLERLA